MAAYKPIRIGDSVPLQQINPSTETIDGKIQVTQTGVVLGRSSAGAGAHEEILFSDLPGGGGASYTEITYADMATALTGGTLTPGGWYLITDAAGTDLGFLTYAVKENEISPAGVGGYLNADFQAVGDYSGVAAITGQAAGTQQGIWQADNEGGYVQGDIVIWNLLHWQLTDSGLIDGTDPATNTVAYTLLDKATYPETYVTAWDVSEFDFVNNWLQRRIDNKGNNIYYTKREDDENLALGYSAILDFQWGRDAIYANVSDDGYIGIKNIIGSFYRNSLAKSAAFQGCEIQQDASVYGFELKLAAGVLTCTFVEQSGANNCTFEAAAAMENITFGVASVIERCIFYHASYFSDCTFGTNSVLSNNILENGAQLTGITAGANCSISRNKIGQGATLGGSTTMGDGAAFNDLDVRANKQISNKALDAAVTLSDKIIQLTTDATETYSVNVEGNRVQPGFSDITGTIDITGLTTLDCTAEWAQYRGIFNITSTNATEAIDTITNPPTLFPFTLRPAAGLVLTITGTAYAGIAAGQIALKATDYTLDGDKGEYIVLEIDPLGTGALIEKAVLNGLI